jgi:hypothetical protein
VDGLTDIVDLTELFDALSWGEGLVNVDCRPSAKTCAAELGRLR